MTITLDRTRRHGVMTAGDSETLAGTATDSAGAAIDLTGASIAYTLTDGTSTLVSKSVGSGITVTVAASGTFSVLLDPVDTAGLEAGTYWHGAAVTSASGTVTTTLRGRLRISRITAASGRPPSTYDTWDDSETWDGIYGTWDGD